MLSLLLLSFSIVARAIPIIDLDIDESGWDNVPSIAPSIVPISSVLNPLPTPVFQQPVVTYLPPPQPQPIPQPSTSYDLGVAQVQVPQYQVPIQVPQYQVPIQAPQVPIQVPQVPIQVPQVPQPTPTDTIPPPIVFPNGD